MKRYLLITAAAAALMAPGVANAAECDTRMTAYDEKIMAKPELRQQVDVRSRRNLRELRDAAAILNRYGKTEACEEVIEAIGEIASDPNALARVRGENAATMEGDYYERAKMRAEQAVPLTEAASQITAADLLGADLHNNTGEDLGSVDDIVLGANGKASFLVVAHGGFLGIGKKQIAVPFDAAKISRDGDTVYINATEERLETAPSFDRDDRTWLSDEKWRETNEKYYMDLAR